MAPDPNLLGRILAFRASMFGKVKDALFSMGENVLELIVALAAMIMTERALGQSGLGVFSYLMSLLFIAGHLSDFGVSRLAEQETARHDGNPEMQARSLVLAHQASYCLGLVCALGFWFSAGFDADLTRIGERSAGYVIIGATLLVRNLNRLRLAALQGEGRHGPAALLKMKKRVCFLALIYFLTRIRLAPSFLMLAFLGSELFLAVMGRRQKKLPSFRKSWQGIAAVKQTLNAGRAFMLTDDLLDAVLYMDFLILGLFVSAWDLGVYAEASVLARFFLVTPAAVKPIFRRHYNVLAARREFGRSAAFFQQSTAALFFFHAVLALYMLRFYPQILHALFSVRGEELVSFQIFTVILPGLIFFSSVSAQEPVYEAAGRVGVLQRIILLAGAANLVLNFYLVPFARFYGSAAATMAAMLLYFLLFGAAASRIYTLNKTAYLQAGAGLYVAAALLEYLHMPPVADIILAPGLAFFLFSVMGVFRTTPHPHLSIAKTPC